MNPKKIITYIIIIVCLIVALNLVAASVYIVHENEYACVARFSKIIKTTDTAGLHFKVPFIDEIRSFYKTQLFHDSAPSSVLTLDKKAMTVDSYIIWKIVDPIEFYKSLGTKEYAENRIDTISFNITQKIIGTINQNDLISSADDKSRDYLNNTVTEQVKNECNIYGIEIVDIKIKKFELPAENENAVFRRMIAERNKNAELYRAEGIQEANIIKNNVDRQVNIIVSDAEARAENIIAEGEAEYMKILADAYNDEDKRDFYVFYRGLDALKNSLTGAGKTVILDKDSIIAKSLINP